MTACSRMDMRPGDEVEPTRPSPSDPKAVGSVRVIVRPLAKTDGTFAAELHCALLPTGLFPRLGTRFLRCYHASFGRSHDAVALVAMVDGRPVGLLAGTTDDRAHYHWVVRHEAWRLAILGATALAWRPRVLAHFARTRVRRYLSGLVRLGRRSAAPGGSSGGGERVGNLAHIAVAPEHQGDGVGAALVDAYVRAAIAAGTTVLRVVTAREGPDVADFYRRLGWEQAGVTVDLDAKPHHHLLRRL